MNIINKEIKQLETKFEFVESNYLNPQFKKGRCKIAYSGNNRNWTGISKESFVEALPSLSLVPVVGYYDESNGEFTDHTGKIEITTNDVKYHVPVPIGVVPENFNYSFETITESNGDIKEYLCCDVILWTGRYDYITDAYIKGNGFRQSMEIEIDDYFCDSDGIMQITKFRFSALCVLQSNVEPCFESSDITLFGLNKDKFRQEFSLMLQELKEDYTKEGDRVEDVKEENIDTAVENETKQEEAIDTNEAMEVEDDTVENGEFEQREETEEQEEVVNDESEIEEVDETDNKEEFKVEESQEYQELLDKFTNASDKILDLENKISEYKTKMEALALEKTELLEFKKRIEKENTLNEIEEISNKFSKKLNKEDIESLKEKTISGEFNIKEFKYELALKLANKELEKDEINEADDNQSLKYNLRSENKEVKNESFNSLEHLFVARNN